MANPRKPPQLKVVAGTSRPDRDFQNGVVIASITSLPDAPTWLPNEHAVREWQRLGPILVSNRLLPETALSLFAVMCCLHGQIARTLLAGTTPRASLLSAHRNLMNDFGLTPASFARVLHGRTSARRNPFSGNGERRG